jgi:AraC family transcriptional regulator
MATNKSNQTPVAELEAPRIENGKVLLIAGLRNRYSAANVDQIPVQWQRFAAYIGKVPGQVGNVTYGLCFPSQGASDLEYLSGVEVSSCSGLPREFSCVSIPAQRYAVFLHSEHVSKLRETCELIGKWLPGSGHESPCAIAGAPNFLERYVEIFNPETGMGGVEIWVPIK